ncbi:MAG: NifU family protein, partial [Caulobacteraceae bacterium]|nr:NifU family protein [Caulobacteraceae bacterium]
MFIQTETTPNPEVLKFLPGRDVLGEGTREFKTAEDAAASPLAEALFDLPGVERVFFGPDFLTVTKAGGDVDWRQLKAPILAAIMEQFTSGATLLREGAAEAVSHD